MLISIFYIIFLYQFLYINVLYQFVISITKTNTQKNTKKINYKGYLSYLNIAFTILIGGFFVYYYNKSTSKDELFEIKLPEIIDAYENDQRSKVYNEIMKLKNNNVSNPIIETYFKKVTTWASSVF